MGSEKMCELLIQRRKRILDKTRKQKMLTLKWTMMCPKCKPMKQVTIAINELQQSQMSLADKLQPKIREEKRKGARWSDTSGK